MAKPRGGRHTKYKREYCIAAEKLCKLGATDVELADFFEIAKSSLNLWKKAHKEFSDSIKRGKQLADAEVAEKLYHRATGYEHPDVHITCYEGDVTITPVIKRYAPDTTACIFWLKNRQKEKWRDKLDHEMTGKDGAELNPAPVLMVTEDVVKSIVEKIRDEF